MTAARRRRTSRWLLLLVTGGVCAVPSTAQPRPRQVVLVVHNGFGTTARARLWGRALEDHGLTSYTQFPVSVEINPHLSATADMVREGKAYSALNPCFVVKVPCTEQGIAASRQLEREGIRTNVTLVFSASQALPPAKNGALFVSPFVGWKEESGEDTGQFVGDIVTTYRNYGFKTQIIVAALRNGKQIVEAARMGADIVTCGLAVYQGAFEHPFTRKGLQIFQDAWDRTAPA